MIKSPHQNQRLDGFETKSRAILIALIKKHVQEIFMSVLLILLSTFQTLGNNFIKYLMQSQVRNPNTTPHALQIKPLQCREIVRKVRLPGVLHDLPHHLLELLRRVELRVDDVDGENRVRYQVESRREGQRPYVDGPRGGLAVLADVSDELLDLPVAEVTEDVEPLGGEHLRVADTAAVAPAMVAGDPSKGSFGVWLRGDGVEEGAIGEGLVVGVEELAGHVGGGGDDDGDGTEAEGDEGAVDVGHLGEGLMRSRA